MTARPSAQPKPVTFSSADPVFREALEELGRTPEDIARRMDSLRSGLAMAECWLLPECRRHSSCLGCPLSEEGQL